jgi:hypothetical protein
MTRDKVKIGMKVKVRKDSNVVYRVKNIFYAEFLAVLEYEVEKTGEMLYGGTIDVSYLTEVKSGV